MKMWKNGFLIILCFYINFVKLEPSTQSDPYENQYGEVIHVSAIFRHGERSPYGTYPKDPYRGYPWPDGFGQLLQLGQQRMYNLGKWYKNRYSKLVAKIRSHTNILMTSSDLDRTIMSAECFLAGFYPLNKQHFLDEHLHWHPVPIHTIPQVIDNVLHIIDDDCPAKIHYTDTFYNHTKLKSIYDKHKKTIDFLQEHTGCKFSRDDIRNFLLKLDEIYDTFFIALQTKKLVLPAWAKSIFPRPLFTIMEDLYYRNISVSLKRKRLYAGPLIKTLISNMIEKTENNSMKLFHFYSAHELTIGFLSSALALRTELIPPYGSSLVFELRRKGKEHFITVFYAKSMKTPPTYLPIPKCGSPCSLQNFKQATLHLIPNDWNAECQPKNKTESVTSQRPYSGKSNYYSRNRYAGKPNPFRRYLGKSNNYSPYRYSGKSNYSRPRYPKYKRT